MAHYNLDTNDFCRDKHGNLDTSFDDLYIPCMNKVQIYHIGQSNLQAYIPSLGRGHNIIKAIYNDTIGNVETLKEILRKKNDEEKITNVYLYETMYNQLNANGLIFDIEENDGEVLFKFKDKNMDIMEKYLKPKINGANRSPFSSRNLPKRKYKIPGEDLNQYKELTKDIPKEKMRVYIDLNNGFMKKISTKKNKIDDIKSDMKKCGLKSKEYFHSKDLWDKYINYIKENVEDLLND